MNTGKALVVGGRGERNRRGLGQAASKHQLASGLQEFALAIYRRQRRNARRKRGRDFLESAETRDFLDQVGLLDKIGAKRGRRDREHALAPSAHLRAERFEAALRDCRRNRGAEERFHHSEIELYLAWLGLARFEVGDRRGFPTAGDFSDQLSCSNQRADLSL